MNATITPATALDVSEIMALVNSAYRGSDARKGWTHEADLIEGTLRVDEPYLNDILSDVHATILLYRIDGRLFGCVYLQLRKGKLYLGMLSVSPEAQAGGIGKQLMQAAEDYARTHRCLAIELTVISSRVELMEWYERRGFQRTGRTSPFAEDKRFGVPTRKLEFELMEKALS